MKGTKTIKYKLVMSVFLTVCLGFFLAGSYIYRYMLETLRTQTVLDEQQKLTQTATQLEYVQESVVGLSKQIVILSELQGLIKDSRNAGSFERLVNHDKVRTLISSYTNMQPYLVSVVVLTTDGLTFSSNQTEGDFLPEEQGWYLEFKDHGLNSGFSRMHTYVTAQGKTQNNVISYIMTFKDIQNGRDIMGDLMIHVNFQEILNKAQLDKSLLNGYAVYDHFGNVILQEGKVSAEFEVIQKAPEGLMKLANGNELLINKALMDEWIMVSEVSEHLLQNKLKPVQNIFMFALAATLLALLGVLYHFINNITKPIRQLSVAAGKLGTGDFNVKVSVKTDDELAVLGNTFNAMVGDLQKLLEESVEYEKKRKEMEIDRLMLQINPHFIYNTLNSIVYMAQMKGDVEIVRFANAFISLLQDTLRIKKDSIYISMEQEMKNIRNYLILQEYRYPERFDVEYDYSEDVLQYEVPNVLIQPIVENAIFHGLVGKMEKGLLVIRIWGENGRLHIEVQDDGVGMQQQKAEQLLNEEAGIGGQMRKIGVANVKDRIEHIYGSEYGLEIDSEEGIGTTVRMTIPCRLYREKDEE